jgi:ATP:ADP antiporter, AAA family
VFNLFAVSVFWSFMADLWGSDAGKRLFGFIAAGGSAGALLGPGAAVVLAVPIGPVNLLIIAAVLLELAVLCARRLEVSVPQPADTPKSQDTATIGGGWLAGIAMVLRSPYLAGIALWVALLSLAGTVLYFQQASIVAAASDDPAVRTRIFATIDLAIGVLTIAVQFLATGRLIKRFGVGPAAAALPFVFVLGFLTLAFTPALWVVIAFQALQRATNFGLSNPAREIFFTVLEREEKYKAKNVIDIVVFRGADAGSSWVFTAARGAGLELSLVSLATIPVAAAWLVLSVALGRGQERRASNAVPLNSTASP